MVVAERRRHAGDQESDRANLLVGRGRGRRRRAWAHGRLAPPLTVFSSFARLAGGGRSLGLVPRFGEELGRQHPSVAEGEYVQDEQHERLVFVVHFFVLDVDHGQDEQRGLAD
jgi:hypothetical protein